MNNVLLFIITSDPGVQWRDNSSEIPFYTPTELDVFSKYISKSLTFPGHEDRSLSGRQEGGWIWGSHCDQH